MDRMTALRKGDKRGARSLALSSDVPPRRAADAPALFARAPIGSFSFRICHEFGDPDPRQGPVPPPLFPIPKTFTDERRRDMKLMKRAAWLLLVGILTFPPTISAQNTGQYL